MINLNCPCYQYHIIFSEHRLTYTKPEWSLPTYKDNIFYIQEILFKLGRKTV